jgi:hypothetical protein
MIEEVTADDRRVEAVFLDGRIVGAVRAVVQGSERAAAESHTVAIAQTVRRELSHTSPACRLKALGCVTTIAAVTALTLNALAPISIGPLSWALPAAVAAGGALVAFLAESLSRAAADRRDSRAHSRNP